jgi:hypothetical protein
MKGGERPGQLVLALSSKACVRSEPTPSIRAFLSRPEAPIVQMAAQFTSTTSTTVPRGAMAFGAHDEKEG